MDVITRLKSSKKRHDGEIRLQGIEDGKFWARNFAEFHELRRLADAVGTDHTYLDGQSAWELQVWLFSVIAPDVDYSAQAVEAHWVETVGQDHQYLLAEPGYIKGFALGALEVYDQVGTEL